MGEVVLKGIAAAPGIAYGSAFILDKQEFIVPMRAVMDQEVPIEIARFEEALIKAREEICTIREKIRQEMGSQHAQIFDAHLLVLEDRMLIEDVINGIKTQKVAAEYIFSKVLKKYVQAIARVKDEYLKERTMDVNDIGKRVLKQLMDETKLHDLQGLTEDLIIIAHDLSPSDAVSMYNKKIIAFVTDIGGKTSHTAIIAKSLGLPAVVGLKDATLRISNQDYIIVDGRQGLVIINPSQGTQDQYRKEMTKIIEVRGRLDEVRDLPAETKDGQRVAILANLELAEEVAAVRKYGAQGIGLYRTEFFYMNRHDLPSEDEQYEAYKSVAESIKPQSVTIRTVDLGGDKFISSVQIPKDMQPFLGWRAIRFCLERSDIFKTQLRAILRASAHGKVRLMYPMISGLWELREANHILNEVKQNLKDEHIPFDENMPVGVMMEVPSAIVIADLIAKETNFFSIGTNDLIQYALAVDRVDEKTAHLYEPGHPAILRLIKRAMDAAYNEKIDVSLCGEIAGEPAYALLLVGMGIESLSMSPSSILQIKKLIRSVNLRDAQRMADEALGLTTGFEVEEYIVAKLKELAPHVYSLDDKKR